MTGARAGHVHAVSGHGPGSKAARVSEQFVRNVETMCRVLGARRGRGSRRGGGWGVGGGGAATQQPTGHSHRLPRPPSVVVATAGRRLVIFDLRNLSAPVEDRESPLKFQTRCVRCFPEQSGFVLASVEGRCAVEFYSETVRAVPRHSSHRGRPPGRNCRSCALIRSSPPVAGQGRFAFKCHRTREQDMDVVYPVNALAFHPRYGTFATGGSDGIVNVWDRVHKKRLSQFRKYNTG